MAWWIFFPDVFRTKTPKYYTNEVFEMSNKETYCYNEKYIILV